MQEIPLPIFKIALDLCICEALDAFVKHLSGEQIGGWEDYDIHIEEFIDMHAMQLAKRINRDSTTTRIKLPEISEKDAQTIINEWYKKEGIRK